MDKDIIAVLDRPELFEQSEMMPFGIEGERKALIVAWDTQSTHPVNAVTNMTEDMWYEIFSFGEGKYPDYTHWRLISVTAAIKGGTRSNSMPPESDVPFSHQFFLVNNQLEQLRDPRNQRTERTKLGMAASEHADGSLGMVNVRNPANIRLLRRMTAHRTEESASLARLEFVPNSVEDVNLEDPASYHRPDEHNNEYWNGGIDPQAISGQYAGLDGNNLTQVLYPHDEKVYINACGMVAATEEEVEYAIEKMAESPNRRRPQGIVESFPPRTVIFNLYLSKGHPLPTVAEVYDPTGGDPFPLAQVCSTAKFYVKLWPW
ncbi:hypothetical protein TWF694_006556 [Orbilia ellipsospora]|uniref:Uncharacterized protein n=1 Tax=Orbilia ellipsospora TaxID=2528407 RepID=A0AAV9XKJ3_9PEZI